MNLGIYIMKNHTVKLFYEYLKYSGIWVGFVFNPYHWQFKYQTKSYEVPNYDNLFDNCVYFGPIWIRVVIDDGKW